LSTSTAPVDRTRTPSFMASRIPVKTAATFILALITLSIIAEARISLVSNRPISRGLPSKGNSGRRLVLADVASESEASHPVSRVLPSKGNSGRRLLA